MVRNWRSPKSAHILEATRPQRPTDAWANGLWASSTPKLNFLLWRLWWWCLPTVDRLIARGADIQRSLIPCNEHDKSLDNAFYACRFSNWILNQCMKTAGNIVQLHGMTSFLSIADALQSFTEGSKLRGILFTLLGNKAASTWQRSVSRSQDSRKKYTTCR